MGVNENVVMIMNENVVKIVGIKKQPSKNDKKRIGTTIFYIQDFDDYSLENATELSGMMCGREFTYSEVDCKVGDIVELLYRKGFNDTATLAGVRLVMPAPVKEEAAPANGEAAPVKKVSAGK